MKFLMITTLFFSLSAYADIEYSPSENGKATSQEISKSRSCFEELKSHGCGDPGDDVEHFRSCLSDVHTSLTDSCKKMMSDLYGTK